MDRRSKNFCCFKCQSSSLYCCFFCCLFSHACVARSCAVLPPENVAKEYQFSKLENEELNPCRVSTQLEGKDSTKNDVARDTAKEESSRIEKERVETAPKNEHKTRNNQAKGNRAEVSRTQKSESAASVSWRVPHKKEGEPEAGYNLDYLPPKTHPPVQN